MDEKKKEESIKKMEDDFSAFQVEWKKFLTNDFHHLVADVGVLNTKIGNMIQQNDKQHNEIKQSIEIILKTEEGTEHNMSTMLEVCTRTFGLLQQGR